ncbi:MAG TPA: hypothetical protein VJ739_07335, partial [Gemmataceae bacterium]|nr:hypothetical protein [Gemmataceae bacterium]
MLMRVLCPTVVAALLFGLVPSLPAAGKTAPKTADYDGKVMPLAKVLEKQGVRMDADAGPTSLVLVADGGKVYPLVKDTGSRMFFKDDRLLNRRMHLTARLLPEVGMLQVVQVQSWHGSQL